MLPGGRFFPLFSHLGTRCKGGQSHSSRQEEKGEPKASFSYRFSEVTLGHFSRCNFWGLLRLQRHGVLLPGGDFFHGVFPFGDADVKVAK